MDASTVHRLASDALSNVGLERIRRSHWRVMTDDLLWSVRLDRGASYSTWSAMFSVAVHDWPDEGEQLTQDYALHGDAVPPSAAVYRWDDHRSYFTAAFDHRQDALPEQERAVAFAFMASDLLALFSSVASLDRLLTEVRVQRLGGLVLRRLRQAAEASR